MGDSFSLLGPIEARRGGTPLPLPAGKPLTLLTVLLVSRGQVVSTDALADALWGESPPPTAPTALQVYVSQLRRLLGRGRIVTRRPGYAVSLGADELDVTRFERLLAEARALATRGEAERAAVRYADALGLWRGEALADFVYEPWASAEAHRLEELRVAAAEEKVASELDAGGGPELVPELEQLVVQHPLRERLRFQLMLALYRSGRRADALAAFRRARAALNEELGVDPSPELVELERRILNQDPTLTPAPPAGRGSPHPLPTAPEAREESPPQLRRKVVTVLFCDVVGSTALGESVDPEALQEQLARYFERMREIVERYGGIVEKFIGDAVMAVFGVPVVHEDDAIRALHAAAAMRAALDDLGFDGRIGIATGEVVAGGEDRLVTGDAVNVAARLEQAAQPGEVLLGESTLRLAGDAVEAERLEPLGLKGKRAPVPAWRLLGVASPAPRRADEPFVGREAELAWLQEAWQRVRAGTRCELVTVVGAPGIGKSRLVAEFVDRVDGTVVTGRCLPYGEGITYWPVVEALKPLEHLLPELDADAGAALAALLAREGGFSTDEIAWAFRKLLESAAGERPLVCVFDDLQWGEEAFLELVEHVAYLTSEARLLLVCMSRPELLERRPGWGGVLALTPLSPEAAGSLIDARLGGRGLEPAVRRRVVEAAAGNPLFVAEMTALMLEQGPGALAVPASIQMLLSARLDQLDERERSVLERGAVEGEVFHRGAVLALAESEPGLTPVLTSLVRNDLIRPARPQVAGEDAYRFKHLLIRDAAYEAIPKRRRAELHDRLADWIDRWATGLVELDEVVGYHLEQACLYRAELGLTQPPSLRDRAGARLATAGRRALSRNDVGAAASLLSRAVRLLDEPGGVELELAEAQYWSGRLAEGEALLTAVAERARAAGDECAALRAELALGLSGSRSGMAPALTKLMELAQEAIPVFEEAGDDAGLMRAWIAIGFAENYVCSFAASIEAYERALAHARALAAERWIENIVLWINVSHFYGPTPVEEAARWHERQTRLERTRPWAVTGRALCIAMLGRLDEGRSQVDEAIARAEQLGDRIALVGCLATAYILATWARDWEDAERRVRRALEAAEEMGDRSWASTLTGRLGLVHYELRRDEEADLASRRSEELGDGNDLLTEITWRQVRAKVAARRGELDQAERLVHEALEIAVRTDMLNVHGDTLICLCDVLERAGRLGEAASAAEDALALYERKGNRVLSALAEDRIARLRGATLPAATG